ncbi:unnamed protein product [Brachionus calyciflorus]|uniref:glutathione transferase n=1 Tax=Brachionus calyciflorus TaxID=104777 RepID=A0A813M8F0_9BILA|nr:unnamed protein product [Brachionus calyciflorus]
MGCGSSNPQNVVEPSKQPVPTENTENLPKAISTRSVRSTKSQNAAASRTSLKQSVENVNPTSSSNLRQSSPNNFKLNYFDLTGRGELIRLVFAAGNINYEDNRVKFEQWPELKELMPLGQLPTLQVNDEFVLVQSLSIARFVAKEAGLAGRDSVEMAKVDAVLETCKEFFDLFAQQVGPQLRNATDEKEEIVRDFLDNVAPSNLQKLQQLVEQYGSEGFSVGEQLTVADLFIHDIITNLIFLDAFILDPYPLLKQNRNATESNDSLRSYLEQRKQLNRRRS